MGRYRVRTGPRKPGSSITSTYKGLTWIRPLSCGFDSSLVEHCTGNAEVVGSNPAQSLNFFRSLF